MQTEKLESQTAASRFHPGAVTLRVIAALLAYPDAQLRGYLAEMNALLVRDGVLAESRRKALETLTRWIGEGEAIDVESAYVETFDRGRATSLHLFEHVHGDSRDRGPAMIDLAQTYEKAGLYLKFGELPDYLPAVLEFVSTQPPREAKAFLSEIAHLVNIIFNALIARGSPYAAVLGALLDLAGEKASTVPAPNEPSLDESWFEPAAFAGCAMAGQQRSEAHPIRIVRKASAAPQGAES